MGVRTADEDIRADIHETIVIKLYRDGALARWSNSSRLQNWLHTVSRNAALDWAKAQNRKKRLPKHDSEKYPESFDAPLGAETDLTLHDLLGSPDLLEAEHRLEDLREFVERVLDGIAGIPNLQIRWTVRLCLLSVLPLSPEERSSLAEFSGTTKDDVASRIGAISEGLKKNAEKSEVALGRAVILWHQMRRLERKINDARRNPLAEPARIEADECELHAMREHRESLLASAFRFHRPSNEEIAPLVRLPPNKVGQVSTMLLRGRRILRGTLGEELERLSAGGEDG